MQAKEIAEKVSEILDNKNATDIQVIKVTEKTTLADYFVIASADNKIKVRSLAEDVRDQIDPLCPLKRVEGEADNRWVLLDYGDVVVHIFDQADRDFYELETIWKE